MPNTLEDTFLARSHLWHIPAKILSQIEGSASVVPVEILALANGNEPASDAVPRFVALYTSKKRVGTLAGEVHRGRLIEEWKKRLYGAFERPRLVDMCISKGFPAASSKQAICPGGRETREAGSLCTTH